MTPSNTLRKFVTGTGAASFLAGGFAFAGDNGKAIIDDKMHIEGSWSICDIFDYSTLYEGESGFIKEIALTGRYHGQHISQQEDVGGVTSNGFHQWQTRRARLGLDIEFSNGVSFFSSLNVSDGDGTSGAFTRDRFFNDFDEVGIEWETDLFAITVGRHKQKITREFSTSSKRIKTIERSHIVNEVSGQKAWCVTVGFETGEIKHAIGSWVTGHDGDWNLPRFESRGALSYQVEVPLSDATDFHFDYVFTNNSGGTVNGSGNAPDGNDAPYGHVFAIGTESEWGRLGLVTDLILGFDREGQGSSGGSNAIPAGNDTWGFVVMPTYEITEKLEAVVKFSYMDEGRNQRTQRYPSRQNVENYSTIYAGLNYYICKDKLKVMGGYEHATGELFGTGTDVDSGTWMVSLRTYF